MAGAVEDESLTLIPRRIERAEHVFQACSFNHSDISPFRINDLRGLLQIRYTDAESPSDFLSLR